MGLIKVTGLSGLRNLLGRFIKSQETYVVNRRYDAMEFLLEAMMENIPVWSGRTIRSIRISTTGELAAVEPAPSQEERKNFGQTSKLALGSEPMRASSEAVARAQLSRARAAKFQDKLFLTVNSEAWDNVERAGPTTGGPGRNRAVVTEIAKAKVRSRFPGVKL